MGVFVFCGTLENGFADSRALESATIVGEYDGEVLNEAGGKTKIGVQITTGEKDQFLAIGYLGGLPGDGWSGAKPVESSGQIKNGRIHFVGDIADVIYQDGTLTVIENGGKIEIGTLAKVARRSATLSADAPQHAIRLFDGKNDGVLPEKVKRLHLEFQLHPAKTSDSEKGIGILTFGKDQELRLSDSFCRTVTPDSSGALSGKAPLVNAALPAQTWQTLDLEFRPDTVNVLLNGTVIHQDLPWKAGEHSAVRWTPQSGELQIRNAWAVGE